VDPERARQRLTEERARIESALRRLDPRGGERDELSDDDDEFADKASDVAEGELEEGLADELQEELAAIGRAEERLANGTYGRSVESGEPIPDGRLEAVPWAERTVDEERRGQ
jgi:RNA polymerase-binding transcription factor